MQSDKPVVASRAIAILSMLRHGRAAQQRARQRHPLRLPLGDARACVVTRGESVS
tara:strand:- start:224 stop:388 length:165 start_codon:yes stop_codon:yes gene_type:complete